MTTKGKQKFVLLMKNIQKLPKARQKFWIDHISTLKASANKELGVEPTSKVIMLPTQNITGTVPKGWVSETSDWFGKVYDKVGTSINDANDAIMLGFANRLDGVYNSIATEVSNVASKSTKAIGTGIGNVTGTGDMWPYVLGAGVALVAVYYFTQISPIRRFV